MPATKLSNGEVSPNVVSVTSGFLLHPNRLQPLSCSIKPTEHPHQPSCSRRFPINLEHSSHAVRELAARGESLPRTCRKQPLPGYRLDLRCCHVDLCDRRAVK